jgi:hypothetical protein
MCGRREQLVQDRWVDRCRSVVTSTGRLPVVRARVKNARAEGRSRSRDRQPVGDLSVLVNRPVEVRPPSRNLDVGLVDEPPVTRAVPTRPGSGDKLRCEPLRPSANADMVDVHASLGEKLFQVAVGRAVPQIHRTALDITSRGNRNPANAEAKPGEITRSFPATSLTQCNSAARVNKLVPYDGELAANDRGHSTRRRNFPPSPTPSSTATWSLASRYAVVGIACVMPRTWLCRTRLARGRWTGRSVGIVPRSTKD